MKVLLVTLVAALLVVASGSGLRAAGEADVLFVSSGSAEVGDEATVTLGVAEIAGAPVGAWTIDIAYDPTVVTATECVALEVSACSPPDYDDDRVRSTGKSQTGLQEATDFARFTFSCDREGESPLTLSVSVWGDGSKPFVQRKVEFRAATVNCSEASEDGVIRIGSYEAVVGDEVTVLLQAVDIPPPGLGAWTVDVTYDPAIVRLLECVPTLGGVCDLEWRDDVLRVTGANARGVEGTFILGAFRFACEMAGTSALTVSLNIFTDASLPGPEVPEISDGVVTCEESIDLLTISSLNLGIGQEGTISVEAERVAQPGVGSWGVELIYDSGFANLISCNAIGELSFCAGDPVKSSAQGFKADGLQAGTVLVEFSFRCNRPGESDIGAFVGIWSVARVGLDERPVEVMPGRITCMETAEATATVLPSLPNVGNQAGSPETPPWLVALLAVVGSVLLAGTFAFRRYFSPR